MREEKYQPKMPDIMEAIFDAGYLIFDLVAAILFFTYAKGNTLFILYGILTLTLCGGDAFHLVPRIIRAACGTNDRIKKQLGIGLQISSITMTVFYILLYYVWRLRYQVEGKRNLTVIVYVLALIRVILCLFPQNEWIHADVPLSWGIYRNIPFALLGLLVILLFYKSAKERKDRSFRFMWLTIVLSFGFYIPVVLWADAIPVIGMLMIPKTCAYVWTVVIGYQDMRKQESNE